MDILDLGKQPVPGAKPAGEDVRYAPEFDELQGEIDKLSIATQDGTGCDWDKVVQLGQLILGEKSKNIQVAAYMAVGLMKTRAAEGLSDGTVVLSDLVENFWDNMYPPKKRLRGRLNAVSWWMDQAEAFLSTYEPDPLPQEMIDGIKSNINRLDHSLSEKSDDAPILSKLRDYVGRLPVQVEETPAVEETPPAETPAAPGDEPAPAATPAPKPTPAAAPAKPATAAPAAPSDIKTRQDADQAIENALYQLEQVSSFLMKNDLSDPMAYQLTRIAAWLTVTQLPMAEKGQTMIPPPDGSYMSSIKNLIGGRDYENAVYSSEALVSQFLFWLDPSRITTEALGELGGKYKDAAETAATATALYIRRLPGIENMSFNDGTPFADKETKAWLKSITLQSGGSGPAVSGGEGAKVTEAFTKAQDFLKDKKLAEAFGLMENGLTAGGSGKARLQWRTALAQLLSLAARPDLARPHLEEILRQIDEYRLESWDPDLAVSSFKVVYEGLSDDDDEETGKLADRVLARLAGISPSVALSLSRG